MAIDRRKHHMDGCCLSFAAALAVNLTMPLTALGWGKGYGDVQDFVIERFEEHAFAVGDGEYKYRLFRPSASETNTAAKWPVLLWLHGDGESGSENLFQLKWLELPFHHSEDPRLFIVALQKPSNIPWATSRVDGGDDPLVLAIKALDDAAAKNPIDANRVYLSGVSSGGTACWALAARYPDRFAAVAPLASSGGDAAIARELLNIPIWAFHSRTDRLPSPDRAKGLADIINREGGNARFAETEPAMNDLTGEWDHHNCWTSAFVDYHLVDWLLQQRRVSPTARTGMQGWKWSPGSIAGGIVAMLMFGWWRAVSRKAGVSVGSQG